MYSSIIYTWFLLCFFVFVCGDNNPLRHDLHIMESSLGKTDVMIRWDCLIITRDSEVIMFSPCVFVCLCVCVCLCLSRCLAGRFNYEGLVPHKQYFAGTLLEMSSCASYVSGTHDVIDDVTRWQRRSKFEIDISPSIFELERRSKAQNVGNANGFLSDIFNLQYNFWWKSLSRAQNGVHFLNF